jgi:hypothetical protein
MLSSSAMEWLFMVHVIAGWIGLNGTPAGAQPLDGFAPGPHFREQLKTFTFEPDVTVHVNAPPVDQYDPAKPTRVVIYALPNANSIAQTIGRRAAPGVDWHYFIQHIGAQIRRLRETNSEENLVVAYVEAGGRSWPRWRRMHDHAEKHIAALVEFIRRHFPVTTTTVDLAGHSGGGSLIFGFIEHAGAIPPWIGRIMFLDANYGFRDERRHAEKLVTWLRASSDHYLGIYAYDDRNVKLNGKLVVGKTGGTYRQTHRMLDGFRRDLPVTHAAERDFDRYQAADNRLDVIILKNPDNRILHTVMVEKNGLIHAMTFATPREGQAGSFFGPPAYEKWIQADARPFDQ